MACSNSNIPGFEENLTIDGAGTDAKVHIDDSTLSGDLTYNAALSQVGAPIPGLASGSVVYEGLITSKADGSQGNAVFFIQATVLNGQPGQLQRMGEDQLIPFDCKAN